MGNVTVTITHNKFPQIAAALPENTKAIVRSAAFAIEAQAKTRCPVDTGALVNSISTEFENGGLTGIIAPHTEYAAYVEFGTKRQSAQPYMIPAAEAVAPVFEAAMRQMLANLDSGSYNSGGLSGLIVSTVKTRVKARVRARIMPYDPRVRARRARYALDPRLRARRARARARRRLLPRLPRVPRLR